MGAYTIARKIRAFKRCRRASLSMLRDSDSDTYCETLKRRPQTRTITQAYSICSNGVCRSPRSLITATWYGPRIVAKDELQSSSTACLNT